MGHRDYGLADEVLIQGKSGNPTNVEITFEVATPEEAESLQRAFIEAGGGGPFPSDKLMYEPIRFCAVTDPFGVGLLVISPLLEHKEHE